MITIKELRKDIEKINDILYFFKTHNLETPELIVKLEKYKQGIIYQISLINCHN